MVDLTNRKGFEAYINQVRQLVEIRKVGITVACCYANTYPYDMVWTPRVQDFVLAVTHQRRGNHKIACVECGAIFDDDDLAFGHETGLCQCCHKPIQAIWVRYIPD